MIPRVARALMSLSMLLPGGTLILTAQEGRQALVAGAQAQEFGDFDTAVRLLSRGLDLAAGPRDAAWRGGLHKLADALIEQQQRPLAEVWVRWALRLEPDLPFDSVNFAPAVKKVFDAARAATRTGAPDPTLLNAHWEWSRSAGSTGQGAVRVQSAQRDVLARIEGGPSLALGGERALAAGTYTIVAEAQGRLPAQVTTEVLPGVTTILTLTLAAAPPGFLYAASRPWGVVWVDGERIGYTTIAAHRLPPGVRKLRIERDGYFPFDTTVTVTQNQRLRLGTIQLRARSR